MPNYIQSRVLIFYFAEFHCKVVTEFSGTEFIDVISPTKASRNSQVAQKQKDKSFMINIKLVSSDGFFFFKGTVSHMSGTRVSPSFTLIKILDRSQASMEKRGHILEGYILCNIFSIRQCITLKSDTNIRFFTKNLKAFYSISTSASIKAVIKSDQ
ncbi:hypothetical protein BCV71DRAFT_235409 [Rhizopus microsporus]|uniref:Uncharacterized protein n=1 Tax=Rhizopus microsporus TaxID=58291 RepID=A0A1X0S0R6_RHIZD|nr:hypothetical protein BCV71DRAFT_235409 [Rhizopus microsporus]